MLDTFHATIKMITGEEVLAEVMPTKERHKDFYVLHNPITVTENMQIDHEKGVAISGMIPKKWMLFSCDELTIVNKQHVVSMCELDKYTVEFYKKALIAAKSSSPVKRKVETEKNSGFVDKISGFRDKIQKIFDDSPNLPKDPSS